jgi:hypothetical protein
LGEQSGVPVHHQADLDVAQAKWLKRCSDRQTNSARSNGLIGRWGGMSVRSAQMAMEKHKLVTSKSEMDAEVDGMDATEEKLWSMWRNDSQETEARIEPKPGKKGKPIAPNTSILIV